MTFVARNITVQINLNSDTFDEGGNVLILSGMRCRVTVQATSGGPSPYQGQAVLQIWGMTESDMGKMSTLGQTPGFFGANYIAVQAGDAINGMTTVFQGYITSAFTDYNAMPDVSLTLEASSTMAHQLPSVAATSVSGSASVESMLQGICANCTPPLTLVNNGVKGSLANHAVAGSSHNQIADICQALPCNYRFGVGNQLVIWPIGVPADGPTVTISAATGMVGYPMYNEMGLDVVTEFNPQIILGCQVSLVSSTPPPPSNAPAGFSGNKIPGATGTFLVQDVVHDLSSQLPDGPWFTKAKVSYANTRFSAT